MQKYFKYKYKILLMYLNSILNTCILNTPQHCSQTSTPLIHCRTDDVVMQVAPLLYQSLLQVVDVTNS